MILDVGEKAQDSDVRHFRCIGIGAGPANLSLASLLHGHTELTNCFVERRHTFAWHDGQQMPGASLQVSMLKDLVTLSDPTNPFSFLSYLHAHGRLYHFINAQFDAVPRQEFRNYMEWATRRNQNIVFGEEVLAVDFDDTFIVRTTNGTLRADNIAVGVGTETWVPQHARDALGAHQFHVSDFLHKAASLGGQRVAVVGGGQSGAEAFLDLISRSGTELPRRVSWISRRPNFLPIDDSPFTNDYYMPSFSDYFYRLERTTRESFTRRHILTSDGISEQTLRDIYQRAYMHRFVHGAVDLFAFHPNREVLQVTGDETTGWKLTLAHNDLTGISEDLDVDVIIWATGFRPARMDFLAPLAHRLDREGDEYRVDESFAVMWDGPTDRNIFVQNGARLQRGLADPNLSLVAWRAQRIVDRLRGVSNENHTPSFIEWSAKQVVAP
ncbi:lysine N(6)-hydroxylase/L-ornithine N(5)-oxygenase family protein [Micromonospora sp. LOL_024]|uniref:lysine N(6)-hydroxylase/L-ornithine N(5)-oxygenase family protein n=1 Tax=Micromonospora sp. LOL_024 TaxID=3345412 RepID=UPI003A88DB7A